ncbi:molybdopterin cofactor-binding domain-containing protein [Cognatishimia sp. F0-27]|uniref:molybdopterin cofactor-binding domain-containing protein n=1 Tax=Cognatishimia sp. F0-27 TaxID=2816855 RepID=UPI001D0C028C|nr:molybdopterin cofactor-binding domain-containing protein [Cognatishimia sp. F0-27]MCC1493719.1 xanthine dehydrogenase family protein molybdopterin-binding subunit [Cognatishimia sp. F0-27]
MSLDAYPLVSDWLTPEQDRLLIHTGKVDIGQRISTALVRIVQEELALPPGQLGIAPVRTGHAPDEGITSGSNSIEQSGRAVAAAAATLRARVLDIAVAQQGGEPANWVLEDGFVHRTGTNIRISLIDLAGDLPPNLPIDPDLPRHSPAQSPKPDMRGITEMVTGTFTFLHDLDLPGMWHARRISPPHAKATLQEIDGSAIDKAEAKGIQVIRDGSFLAVAGPREWDVVKAARSLGIACTWDLGGGFPETDVFAHLAPENADRFPVVDGTPQKAPVPDALDAPDLSARFERPYQMHGALAPSAALAEWTGTELDIKSHSQGIYPLREAIADSLELSTDKVEITHVPGSGCYGHNGADDAAFEAALIAIALPNTPILLKWSREDEHAWEPFAPAMAVQVDAKMTDGCVTAFSAEAHSDTHRGRPRPGPNRAGPAKLLANRFRADAMAPYIAPPNMGKHAGMHRNLDPIYAFPEKRLVKNLVQNLPHRTSAMRCLGAVTNVFAIECTMDDLASQTGMDPIAFRQAHLTDPRASAVLRELERRLDNRGPRPDGTGRGIAYAQYKNAMTRVGIAVDVTVTDAADVRLDHAIIVADSGRVIDPDGLTAQLEGGFIQAASWALCEEVTWDRDGITSRDWDSYPVIRFDNVPDIEVVLLDTFDNPSVGAGEASPGPTVAAIANAIQDCTGLRMRRMPFTADALKQAALAL